MKIKPFAALRPTVALVHKVAAPPYDVLSSAEARTLAAGNAYSFLHVTKSEIDVDATVDIHSKLVYDTAASNLQQLISNGTLLQDATPCYYIYELTMHGRTQTGLVCTSAVADYNADLIKKHEYTRPEKEQDRIQHMLTIQAHTGNVFLAYRDVPSINEIILAIKATIPTYNFVADDGIAHKVWVVQDAATIASITHTFATQVPVTYIADGHHRAASAAKVAAAQADNATAQFFLTTIFPESELAIMEYNRVVKDLNGLTSVAFVQALQQSFTVVPSSTPVQPNQLHQLGMYLAGQWYTLTGLEHTYTTNAISVLDVSILQHYVLDAILGITDVRTSTRIEFVGGIRGLQALEHLVDNGTMAAAFSMYPVSIHQLFAIADNNMVMPPKSTWFEPKLRDGLLTHLL